MTESTITAEDLTLYALNLLEGEEQAQVEAMLHRSTGAREELARIRGDLSLFAIAAEQHTPPALTRQRLLKQVARERRTAPVALVMPDDGVRPAAHTFQAGADHPGNVPSRAIRLPLSDPQITSQVSANMPKVPPTRTFTSRSQARAATTPKAGLPIPRVVQETDAVHEASAATFSAGTGALAGEAASFGADRQTFSPDPQVFPREARALATSASAHSMTMFEQHFATETVPQAQVPDLPPDPEAYSGRPSKGTADPFATVQDRFVPSESARAESFAFSSYRDYEVDEPRTSGIGRWLAWSGWAVAAAVTIAAVFALRDDFNLRERASQQQSLLAAAEASAARAEMVMQTLQSPSSQHYLLARTDAAPAPSGRVAYLPERGTVVFQGSSLETLQPYKTYALWLIPAGEGRQPIPAGLFKPDGHGYATVVLPQLQKGIIAANFGVTIEDEGGSPTPTLPIILVGQPS